MRKDIVTHDIFFYQNEEIVDYLSIKCLHFNYKYLPKEVVVKSRIIQNSTKIILDYMKQHLIVFPPNDPVFCKQRMHSYNLCLQFKFKECLEENPPLYSDIPCDVNFEILRMMMMMMMMIMMMMKLTELRRRSRDTAVFQCT